VLVITIAAATGGLVVLSLDVCMCACTMYARKKGKSLVGARASEQVEDWWKPVTCRRRVRSVSFAMRKIQLGILIRVLMCLAVLRT
jgi:hypothetical protein